MLVQAILSGSEVVVLRGVTGAVTGGLLGLFPLREQGWPPSARTGCSDPSRRGRARAPADDRPPPRRGLHQPEHPPGVLRGAPPPRRLARRPATRGCDPRRLPRRTSRPGPGAGERVDDGGRGVLPGPPRQGAEPGRGTDGPGPGRLPADRRRSRPGPDAAVRGRRPRRRPRHLPPARGAAAAASSPTPSPASAAASTP